MKFTVKKTQLLKMGGAFVVALVAFGLFREFTIQDQPSPVEVFYKVRNLSAKEREWNIATVAQPGDVVEHFVLIHVPETLTEPINDIRVSYDGERGEQYRDETFTSASQGINNANSSSYVESFFNGKGVELAQVAPGEFTDFRWQSLVSNEIAFDQKSAPLIESDVEVRAPTYSSVISKTLVSLFSTIERSRTIVEDPIVYEPVVLGMNPRQAYEDLGAGVVIAGEDFGGIADLRIVGTRRSLVWRADSNEVIEASIPAGLEPGEHAIEFVDTDGKVLEDTFTFTVLPSKDRAVVVQTTPSTIESGVRRTLVLQGIHLSPDVHIQLRDQSRGQLFALEHQSSINNRVMTAEVPESARSGQYTIYVNDTVQQTTLRIN